MNLQKLAQKKTIQVLGIMNGTSIDGVDFVLTKIQKSTIPSAAPKISYVAEHSFAFPKALQGKLRLAAKHELKVDQLALLHHELGRFYAACFKKLPTTMQSADLIGLHGQTVYHQAPKSTLQIGESSYLSAVAGVPVVSDFRSGDMALGGQGAPIASLFHQVAFMGDREISIHNLGGISNLSIVSKRGVKLAFDTGPANMLMDLCMQRLSNGKISFDRNGALAKKGRAHLNLVGELLKHKYFRSPPPKSCGREEFGENILKQVLRSARGLSPADKMATLAEFTVWSIALSYQKFVKQVPDRIVFCGGGAKNSFLLERLQILMPETQVWTSENFGWPASSIEGAAFALLAAYRLWDKPSNLPHTTGARRATVLGKITSV